MTEGKLKAGIFADFQILKLMKDEHFEKVLAHLIFLHKNYLKLFLETTAPQKEK